MGVRDTLGMVAFDHVRKYLRDPVIGSFFALPGASHCRLARVPL